MKKKSDNSEDEKKKRPERKLYVAPALRSKSNEDCEDKMDYAKDKYVSEAANRQSYSIGNRDSSQRATNIAPRRVRFDSSSSSSNPRNISDESCKNSDSSDFEDCCSVSTEAMRHEEISMGTNKKNSDVHWNKERRGKSNHDIETENYQTNTKISNRSLMKHEDYSDVKSHANQSLIFESNETKLDRGLFFNSDDSSISDIDATTDDRMKTRRVLTSTPNSDIVEQKVLDAAKYDSGEESELESTLLNQSDIRGITINRNRNKCDYNFEIYQDPSSATSHSTDYSAIFGNNYIPPPVPPPASGFRLPPIHRLPSPIPSPHTLSVLRHASPQKMPQLLTQLRHPRLLLPSSLQLDSRLPAPSSFIPPNSSHTPPVLRYVLQPASPRAPNPPRMPSSVPSTLLPQRFNPPRSPQDAANSPHLHQRSLIPRSLESYKQDDSFYIPPPVPPLQQMDGSQQIRNLNQLETVQSCQPYSISSVNKIVFDDKILPQNPKTRR